MKRIRGRRRAMNHCLVWMSWERWSGVRLAVVLSTVVLVGARPSVAIDSDFQVWTPVYLTVSYADNILGWYEVQPRFGEDASRVNQLLLRTAMGYRFAPNWSVWLGYAWTPAFVPRFRSESRMYQQLLYLADFSIARVMSRTRFEQRWIDRVDVTAFRLRTLLERTVSADREPSAGARWCRTRSSST